MSPEETQGEGLKPINRERACRAAAVASKTFGQWVPQRWLELFLQAYEADQ